jgi:hypothetical protein
VSAQYPPALTTSPAGFDQRYLASGDLAGGVKGSGVTLLARRIYLGAKKNQQLVHDGEHSSGHGGSAARRRCEYGERQGQQRRRSYAKHHRAQANMSD